MEKHVLIVHPDSNMIQAIEVLLEAQGYNLLVEQAETHNEAKDIVEKEQHFDLVITALEIPEGNGTPAGAGEQHRRGLELVRGLRAVSPGTAAILITGLVDNEVIAFTQSNEVGLAMEGKDFGKQLQSEINKCLASRKTEPPRRVDLVLSLSTENGCSYQFQPEGRLAPTGQAITVDPSRLKDLVDQSLDVSNRFADNTWKTELKRVGETLADELFQGTPTNLEFRDNFNFWVGKVGIENIRVRFAVQDTLHPIAVEALKRRRDNDYWMVQTAIFRQESHRGGALEPRLLFQDEQAKDGPINILVIQANVDDNAVAEFDNQFLSLDQLPNLKDEVAVMETLLSGLKQQGCRIIGDVHVIKREDVRSGSSFERLVETTLARGPWHIVHYAGHTYYHTYTPPNTQSQIQVGYLFFPRDENPGPVDSVKIDKFAYFLRNADTRFVFLSSCASAQQDFIYHLAKQGIPAIMGFLWKVQDARAGEYVESFYRHLLGGNRRSLEYACLEAKKEMKAKCEDSPIWASAVLVTQAGV